MNNRLFVAVAILVMGFLLFVFSVVQNNNNAILDRVAMQQEKILNIQQGLALKPNSAAPSFQIVTPSQPAAASSGSNVDVNALLNKIAALESRLASLETDAKPVIDQVKAQKAAYEQQRKEMEEAMKKVHDITIGNSPVRGNKNAPVTLVEFTDFQCPYCSRFHSVSQELLKAYPDKVKFVLKNYPLPFHQEAKPAAKAVLAAKEQGKYWEMVDAILKDNSALNTAKYEELAKSIGLNVDKFRKDLKANDAAYEKALQDDMALAAAVSVRGTPAFYLNGRMTPPDVSAMKAAIDEALKK
ncbi:MAG: thioredoxin domain-containing protein [Candidatus Omnitrophica bacterium]|nr:thioredoxin domain-containing protein [Candidatus Omnitrophota bacterium]